MALSNVDEKIFELLKKEYSLRYGSSASRLVAALDKHFEDVDKRGIHVISERAIYNFFNDATKRKNETYLNYLCTVLLDCEGYESALEKYRDKNTDAQIGLDNLEATINAGPLLTKMLEEQKIRTVRDCKDMKILTMDEPIPIDRIFVSTNILKRGTKHKLIRDLLSDDGSRNTQVGQLGFTVSREGVPASEIVGHHSKIMVWGRLGAGKTTFLKHLALNFDDGKYTAAVYVRLRDLDIENGKTLLEKIYSIFSVETQIQKKLLEKLLLEGKLLLLLDGLDEVKRSQFNQVRQDIVNLVDSYPNNQFIVTCRLGVYDYGFRDFTEIEIANFNDEQINLFVKKWFEGRGEEDQSDQLLALFREDESLKTYAANPLQLNLLCLSIDRGIEIPPRNKYALYENSALALLEKWDNYRLIKRPKSKLTKSKKITFLSEIAFKGMSRFPRQEVWRLWELEDSISSILQQTSDYDADSIEEDRRTEVKTIESHHGLLEELTPGLYAFSSIAFQEYFAATYVVNNPDAIESTIDRHLADRLWKDVFLMVAERLSKADHFFESAFKKAVQLVQTENLQNFLDWLSRTTQNCNVSTTSWRAGCLAINTEVDFYLNRSGFNSDTRLIAHQLAETSQRQSARRKTLIKMTPQYKIRLTLAALHALAEDKSISDTSTGERRKVAGGSTSDFARTYLTSVNIDAEESIRRVIQTANELEFLELAQEIDELGQCIPQGSPLQWKDWADSLGSSMMKHLDIGYNILLSSEEIDALSDYLYINNLLLECLQVDSFASHQLREEIWRYMLLPNDQIPYTLKS